MNHESTPIYAHSNAVPDMKIYSPERGGNILAAELEDRALEAVVQ